MSLAARLTLVAAVLGIASLAVTLLHPGEGHFAFESWPGFHAGLAVAAVVALAGLARVGRALLGRREDTYDRA